MQRKIKGILILLGIIAVLVCILPLPMPVNKTISGIDFYNGDSEKVSEDQIIIKGVYYRYLFRKNVFKGDIHVVGMDPNEDLTLLKIIFLWQEEMNSNWGPLSYYSAGKNEICYVGNSYIKGVFGKILIKYSDADNGNHLFAAPAENREEAVALANKVTNGVFKIR